MPDHMSVLLKRYREAVVQILGERFSRMILFGSYARGDFKKESDMDIMILVDVGPEEISSYADKVYDVTYDFEMQYGMEINPSLQSTRTYEQWRKVYPFFINIEKDGVLV
ncbi:MAG: nucleotidyltransferase domain-containing protein [Lachnospiraceae bacterium]|nr:nucleotidyltransferase domain-containing protein [Lachnospiraceae bacterium]